MALTLRQTIATGATNKGSELTYSELDANFVHLLESSNHNFTQSGSGLSSTTVQGAIEEVATERAAMFDTVSPFNFFLGTGNDSAITTGSENYFSGLNAGRFCTEGIGNIGIGHSALASLTTGINNTAIGWDSMLLLTTGNNNTGLGEDALKAITDGENNTGIGYASGIALTTGDKNICIAPNSLFACTTGSQNIAIGYGAAIAATGGDNIAIGVGALRLAAGVNQNVCIGTSAGDALAGSANICIGYVAGAFETGTKKLYLDSVLRSNEADGRIKSPIYGEMNATITSQFVRFNGNVQAAGDGNGSTANIKSATTSVTAAAGATVTATNLIPAKAFLIGVSTRITTTLGATSGTTGFNVGDVTDADRFGVQAAITAGSTTSNGDATADPTGWALAARSVVLTAVGGNFDGTGAVRVTVHYFDNTAPTA
jgi:hypothetical protein